MTREKPTLLTLRRGTTITSKMLAQEAGVTLSESYAVEIAGFSTPEVAIRVISAFNRLTNSHYTVDDIMLFQSPALDSAILMINE